MKGFEFSDIVRSFRRDFAGSAVTAAFLTLFFGFGYTVFHLISTGGSFADLFVSSVKIAEAQHWGATQREVTMVTKSNTLIEEALKLLLSDYPLAARARISVVHNGTYVSRSQIPILRFDTMWAKANPGFQQGELTKDTALSTWNDFMPKLIESKCIVIKTTDLINTGLRARLEQSNTAVFAGCPVNNVRHEMLGALFISWDDVKRIPADTERLFDSMRLAAAQVAGYLEMRNQ